MENRIWVVTYPRNRKNKNRKKTYYDEHTYLKAMSRYVSNVKVQIFTMEAEFSAKAKDIHKSHLKLKNREKRLGELLD